MKLYIFPNYKKALTQSALDRIKSWAEGKAEIICEDTDRVKECDFIVTIGGDGTVIRASSFSAEYGIPMVGVHTGTLGFLTSVQLDRLEELLDRMLSKNYSVSERMVLKAELPQGGYRLALNDVVFQNSSHSGVCEIEAKVGKNIVSDYKGDGIIVTSPTGSTAYAFSAGGSIIDPESRIMEIVPICPQDRKSGPYIFDGGKEVVVSPKKGLLRVLCDGVEICSAEKGNVIKISAFEKNVSLIQFD